MSVAMRVVGRSSGWTFVLAVVTGLLTTAAACAPLDRPGPSHVAQGRRYTTGDANYDDFFAALHRLQVELDRAPHEERALRTQLSARLGTGRDVTLDALAVRVERRVNRLRHAGIRTRLVVDEGHHDHGADVALRTSGEPEAKDRSFLQAVEDTARGSVRLMVRMRQRQRQLERLRWLAQALSRNLERSFAGRSSATRAKLRRNLEDAELIILLMLARTSEVGDAARETLGKLEQATRGDLVCTEEPVERDAVRPRPPPPATPAVAPSEGELVAPPDFEP